MQLMWRLIRPWITSGSHESDPYWLYRVNSLVIGKPIGLGEFELRLVSIERGVFTVGSIISAPKKSDECLVVTIEVLNRTNAKAITPFILVQRAVDNLGNALEEAIKPFEWIKGDKRMEKLGTGRTAPVKIAIIPQQTQPCDYELNAVFDPGGESACFAVAFDASEIASQGEEPADF